MRLYRLDGRTILDSTKVEVAPLRVQITWEKGTIKNTWIPKLDKKDINFAFVKQNGEVVHLEFAFVNRGPRFYVSCQVVWRGQAVNDGNGHVAVLPAHVDHAYPDADYTQSAVGGSDVVSVAAQRGWFVNHPDYRPVVWGAVLPALPDDLSEKGFVSAVVKWFNPSLGGGQAGLSDGKCFVHMRHLEGQRFPLLHARQGIAVKLEQGPKGLVATEVRFLAP